MRVSPAALALCISGTVAFVPCLPRNGVKTTEFITCLQQAARPEFPTPKVTSTTRISTDSTQSKSIMEARHSLLEIETSAEKAREYLEYLQKVADVVTCFLQDESTPLRSNLQLPELQNVKEATLYLVNIQLATTSAKEYLQYLDKMAREIKVHLQKLQRDYPKNAEYNAIETLEAQFQLEDLEETAEAARDYLKYLQTVSSVVQTSLVDPNLHKISIPGIPQMQDFMPRHQQKTASSEEKRTHMKTRTRIPPPAPSLQVDSKKSPVQRRISEGFHNVGAYLETLKPSSTALTAVTGNNMEYLDTVASSSQKSGVMTDGGTISQYLDSIDPQFKRKRRYLNMHDLQTINNASPPTTRRQSDDDDYDRAKAAAAGMMDIPATTPGINTARRRPFDSQSSTTQPTEDAYRANTASNDNVSGANEKTDGGSNASPFPDQSAQQRPNPWSQASSGTATGSPPVSSSSLIGEVQMPSDWMKPKGPMVDLFGGGSTSVSPAQQPPPKSDSTMGNGAETTVPTQIGDWMQPREPMTNNEDDSTSASTEPPNVSRKPRDLLNEVRQLDAQSIKEKNAPTLGRLNTDATRRQVSPSSMAQGAIPTPPTDMQDKGQIADNWGSTGSSSSAAPQQGQNVNQRPKPASGYNSNVNGGSSVGTLSDWMQPKGPMAGGGMSSSSASTANNDWMPASSLPPPQASRRPRDLRSEGQSLHSLSRKEQTVSSQPPPVPPEAYLDQMAAPNETIDWSNYNAGSPAIASSVSGSTSAEPYYDETPIETVDWSYLDPGKRSPASAAANTQPVSVLDEPQSSSYAGQNPWVAPLKEQAALSSSSYQEQTMSLARRRATTLPPVPTSIRSFLDQVKLSTQRGRQIDWSRTRDTKRIRIAPQRLEESDYYPNPLPQTSQPVDWTSVAEASTIPEPGTGGFLQSKPYNTIETGGQLAEPKYFFLEEPVEDFFFTKLGGPNGFERKAGEPISPKLPILGAKYMEQLEQVARQNPLNLKEELEKRRVLEDDELEEPGYFERIFEAGEMINGRLAMFFLLLGLGIEYTTGATLPTQIGAMGQEWNGFIGRLSGSSQGQNVVQNPAAAKLEKSVHEAGSSKVQQSVQATVTAPTPPPPPVMNKEVKESSKSIENDQAVQSPKADVKVPHDEVKASNVQQPIRDTAPAAVQSSGEASQSPKPDVPNRPPAETEKVQPQMSVPSAHSAVAEPPSTETVKQQAQLEETASAEVKQPTQETMPATAPAPPVVEKPPPVAVPKSSVTAVEKDEEADDSDKPSFPNLENWSF